VSWLSDASVARLREAADRPDLSGTRYQIEREIGRGGMGVVYEAKDGLLERTVALKVLAPEWSHCDAAERLQREAKTIARLEHPGIVPVHDAGETRDGRVFYAMKLVRGVSLAEYARTHGRADLLRVFLRACEAVAYAHARGVVHRDIKPENIMVGGFGEVLVLDWGVATAAHDEEENVVVGTRAFMAPEQARGEPARPESDVYSLGVVLRGLLASSEGKIPRRLGGIVAKATRDDASQRYADAGLLAEDVTRFVDGEAVSAYRDTLVERMLLWADRHRALLAMILMYLVMRAALLFWTSR
jgi:eukaryotic-like serine/threonine-protein kinase